MIRGLLTGLILMWGGASDAAVCADESFEDVTYTICRVNAAEEDLRLFLADDTGEVYGHFREVNTALGARGQRLGFAMNAGMYHNDRTPVGHYLENGREVMRVLTGASEGNFGLLPNGIFCLRPGQADVIETLRFVAEAPDCRDATQSGPMLVIDGALHPRFLVDSTSRFIRNGVGTSDDGTSAVFAISRLPVTFHQFGRLFRDHLGLRQALYFDGNISRLYAPKIGRRDGGFRMGPIVGTVEALD